MSSPDVESLKTALSLWTTWNDRATFAVVVGVIIELFALLFFGKEMPLREKVTLFVGSLLVVVGVGGEYTFGARASRAAAQLQQVSDERIAALGKEQGADHRLAATAAADAGRLGVSVDTLHDFVTTQERRNTAAIATLRSTTAGLNRARDDALAAAASTRKDLDEITGLLDQERELRQQIVALTLHRSLTDEQISRIGALIAPYARTPFDLSAYDDPEANDFVKRIALAMKAGSWDWRTWRSGGVITTTNLLPGSPAVGTVTLQGVAIQIVDSDRDTLGKPMVALVAALNSNGVAVREASVLTADQAAGAGRMAGLIHIMIGARQ